MMPTFFKHVIDLCSDLTAKLRDPWKPAVDWKLTGCWGVQQQNSEQHAAVSFSIVHCKSSWRLWFLWFPSLNAVISSAKQIMQIQLVWLGCSQPLQRQCPANHGKNCKKKLNNTKLWLKTDRPVPNACWFAVGTLSDQTCSHKFW